MLSRRQPLQSQQFFPQFQPQIRASYPQSTNGIYNSRPNSPSSFSSFKSVPSLSASVHPAIQPQTQTQFNPIGSSRNRSRSNSPISGGRSINSNPPPPPLPIYSSKKNFDSNSKYSDQSSNKQNQAPRNQQFKTEESDQNVLSEKVYF
jgi:hypothetical protein